MPIFKQGSIALFSIFFASLAYAHDDDGVLNKRSSERKQQRWQLSDWLALKAKIREQDFLYRLYTSEKTKPQVEPHLYALAASGTETSSAGKVAKIHLGYGASIYFNHLLSGLTGWPTPNVVLGGFAEKRDVKHESHLEEHLTAGGSLRFFARNHSDSAIFLNYTFHRRPLQNTLFKEWIWDIGSRIYVLPFLDLEGGISFNQNFLRGSPSNRATQRFHYYGVSVEASSLRVTVRQEEHSFTPTNAQQVESSFTSLGLGLVI
jgi:hypothetical protein